MTMRQRRGKPYIRRPQPRPVKRRRRPCLMCRRVVEFERSRFVCDQYKASPPWQAGVWP
jgi:hypothetical protein